MSRGESPWMYCRTIICNLMVINNMFNFELKKKVLKPLKKLLMKSIEKNNGYNNKKNIKLLLDVLIYQSFPSPIPLAPGGGSMNIWPIGTVYATKINAIVTINKNFQFSTNL